MRDITFIILLLRSMLTNKILTIGLLGLFFAQQQQYCLKHLRIDTATDGGVQPELEAAVVQQPAVELTVSSRLPLVDLPTAVMVAMPMVAALTAAAAIQEPLPVK
jgi:hypothetical protein